MAIKVAIVIPDTGLEELPMSPTILELTVTKKKPKTRINSAEKKLVGRLGKTIIKTNKTRLPINTKYKGKSFSVLGIDSLRSVDFPCSLKSFKESLKALTIVGRDLISVIIPPKVTAPAPIYRIYLLQISSGDMSLINFTVSGAKGTVKPSPMSVMSGISTNQERTPPATMTPAILGPIIYPTPKSSGVISPLIVPLGKADVFLKIKAGTSFQSPKIDIAALYINAMPRPKNTLPAKSPPFSPAINTSAQAVPSG